MVFDRSPSQVNPFKFYYSCSDLGEHLLSFLSVQFSVYFPILQHLSETICISFSTAIWHLISCLNLACHCWLKYIGCWELKPICHQYLLSLDPCRVFILLTFFHSSTLLLLKQNHLFLIYCKYIGFFPLSFWIIYLI